MYPHGKGLLVAKETSRDPAKVVGMPKTFAVWAQAEAHSENPVWGL